MKLFFLRIWAILNGGGGIIENKKYYKGIEDWMNKKGFKKITLEK